MSSLWSAVEAWDFLLKGVESSQGAISHYWPCLAGYELSALGGLADSYRTRQLGLW